MRPAAVAALLVMASLSGCAGSPPAGGDRTVTVFAAASLKSVFTALGRRFERDNPGTVVRFSFAGSADLVTQLIQGAPADVFAAADERNMARAVEAGLVEGEPVVIATNTLTIVTPAGNPKKVASFADLAKPDVAVVVCAPQVPCGAATQRVEEATGVTLTPVSEESAVTDVLGKVVSGQADAGLVYRTDARSAGPAVDEVPVPAAAEAVNRYPIALLRSAADTAAARLFVDLVTGPPGREALAEAGFGAP